jgi:hypothetical protein
MQRLAIISCGKYRYRLDRKWGDAGRPAVFISSSVTAEGEVDDLTIRRCIGFAKEWACGSLTVVNLFAVRATKPDDMKAADD